MSRGLKLLAAAVKPAPQVSVWSWATVTDDSPLRVQLDGEAAALDVTPDTLVAGLLVGDRVWAQLVTNADAARQYRRLVVLGKAAGWARQGTTLRLTANQAVGSGGSATVISWSSADYGSPEMWSGGGTVTIPSDGLWTFGFQTEWSAAIGPGRAFLSIEDGSGTIYRLPYAGTSETRVAMSWTMPVTAGTTFTCKVFQSSGGSLNVAAARLHCYRTGA